MKAYSPVLRSPSAGPLPRKGKRTAQEVAMSATPCSASSSPPSYANGMRGSSRMRNVRQLLRKGKSSRSRLRRLKTLTVRDTAQASRRPTAARSCASRGPGPTGLPSTSGTVNALPCLLIPGASSPASRCPGMRSASGTLQPRSVIRRPSTSSGTAMAERTRCLSRYSWVPTE